MTFLTDFADQAVMLPLAVTVCIMLALAGWRQGAIAWALAVSGTLLAVVLAKMAIVIGGHLLPLHSLRSPSGHTASAAVVYGGLVALLLPEPARGARRPFLALLLAAIFATLVGGSRLALNVHTHLDVLAGALIGVAGALALARLAGPRPPTLSRVAPLAGAVIVLALFHGQHLHAEMRLGHMTRVVWEIVRGRYQPG